MISWTMECLRRAVIAGCLVFLAVNTDSLAVRIGALVAFVVFLFSIPRNPEGWARRIAHFCVTLGSGALFRVATAVQATGWIETDVKSDNFGLMGGLLLTFEKGSTTAGIVLVSIGVVFGLLDLYRQPLAGSKSPPRPPGVEALGFRTFWRHKNGRTVCAFPLTNNRGEDLLIGGIEPRAVRIVDRLLLATPIDVEDFTILQPVRGDAPPETIEVTERSPMEISAGEQRHVEVALSLSDRIGEVSFC